MKIADVFTSYSLSPRQEQLCRALERGEEVRPNEQEYRTLDRMVGLGVAVETSPGVFKIRDDAR